MLLTSCGGGSGGSVLPSEDNIPPEIVSKTPDNRKIDIAIFQDIVITFNESINPVSDNDIVLLKYPSKNPNNFDENIASNDRVKTSARVEGNKLIITPNPGNVSGFTPYTIESRYKITLVAIKDKNNNQMLNTAWEFATTTIPVAENIQPTKNDIVSRATDILIQFSELMSITSLESSLTLVNETTQTKVTGLSVTFNSSSFVATYKLPNSFLLDSNSKYTVTLSTQVTDVNGNKIIKSISSSFNTNAKTVSNVLTTQPSNVVAIPGNSSIELSWAVAPAIPGNSNAITYNVYVSTDGSIYSRVLSNITATSYTDYNVMNDSTYRYAVTANEGAVESVKVFSDSITPSSILSAPDIKVFTAEIIDNDPTTIAGKNITITEGQSITLKTIFKNGSGIISFTDNSKISAPVVNIVTGTTNIRPVTFTKVLFPTVTTIYTFTVVKTNETTASQSVTVIVLKPGLFSFELLESQVSESIDMLTLKVLRKNGTDGIVSVDYKTNLGGSTAANDFVATSGILEFGNGVVDKIFTIKINDNKIMNQSNRVFSVSLNNPTNGAGLDTTNSLHTITIVDNDILSLSLGAKQLKFKWREYPSSVGYKLMENAFGRGFVEAALTSPAVPTTNLDGSVTFTKIYNIGTYEYDWDNTSYYIDACDIKNCISTNIIGTANQSLKTIGYVPNNNNVGTIGFANSIALSSDGNTMAVGAPLKGGDTGVVYIFTLTNNRTWTQTAIVTPSNPDIKDKFGTAIALSADGNTLVVSSPNEDGNYKGIINSATPAITDTPASSDSGAVYIFTRTNSLWTQKAYIKASNSGTTDLFGNSVALSASGDTLIVGASWESGNYKGVINSANPVVTDTSNSYLSGAVYVFIRANSTWSQQAYVKASNSGYADVFGSSVTVSADGNTLVVGAYQEHSDTPGVINSATPITNDKLVSGAVYVFSRSAQKWTQQSYIKASNPGLNDLFGRVVSLSADGSTLAVSASRENGGNKGIINSANPITDGNAPVNSSGVVYVFMRKTDQWSQQAYIKASSTYTNDYFGESVVLSSDGNTLVVGVLNEDGNGKGVINGTDPVIIKSGFSKNSGAVYIFNRVTNIWQQKSYIKTGDTSNPGDADLFGYSLALSKNRINNKNINTLVVGVPGARQGAFRSMGAVFVY